MGLELEMKMGMSKDLQWGKMMGLELEMKMGMSKEFLLE